MRIKFKLLPGQYAELINAIGILSIKATQNKNVNAIDLINIKDFYFNGVQKVQLLQFKNQIAWVKEKPFSIDVNHYESCKKLLSTPGMPQSVYVEAVFRTIETVSEPTILSEVSRLKQLRQ